MMDIQVNHPDNWGKVLTGAAHFVPDAVQWVGTQSTRNLTVTVSAFPFGFSGASTYIGEVPKPNEWSYEGNKVAIGNPSSPSPVMGMYFAPGFPRSESIQREATYSTDGVVNKSVPVTGESVPDSETTPALTLEMEIQGAVYQNGQLNLPAGDIAVVKLTPGLTEDRLPADILPVQYVMLNIIFEGDINNQTFFKEKIVTAKSFVADDYLHYLNATGPETPLAGQTRTHIILVSVGKTVELHLSAQQEAQGSQAKYICCMQGHYDSAHPDKWPGSHHDIQVIV
jgi:hypothetical protein